MIVTSGFFKVNESAVSGRILPGAAREQCRLLSVNGPSDVRYPASRLRMVEPRGWLKGQKSAERGACATAEASRQGSPI